MSEFARALTLWHERHGRHDLPWQRDSDPYRIWVSEVMLQQTTVSAVIPYYERFLKRFPDLRTLAQASQDAVMALWSGLGYYARARNLHRAAGIVLSEYGGVVPGTVEELESLPGLGRSSAAAIAVFAYGRKAAILDGNVKRLFARHFGIRGYPGETGTLARLWILAQSLLPARRIERYTQALMDIGATVCTRAAPRCDECPVGRTCVARRDGLTRVLPARRPPKSYPERQATWLVLVHRDRVLLRRRPPLGLWGGLWSFPEHDDSAPQEYCRTHLGCDVSNVQALPVVAHGFTHFRLHVRPLVCSVRRVSAHVAASADRWFDIDATSILATPAPVKRLLENLERSGAR